MGQVKAHGELIARETAALVEAMEELRADRRRGHGHPGPAGRGAGGSVRGAGHHDLRARRRHGDVRDRPGRRAARDARREGRPARARPGPGRAARGAAGRSPDHGARAADQVGLRGAAWRDRRAGRQPGGSAPRSRSTGAWRRSPSASTRSWSWPPTRWRTGQPERPRARSRSACAPTSTTASPPSRG